MALTGSGNFTEHPTKLKVLRQINKRKLMLEKSGHLPKYLQKDISVMTWNELRQYNSILKTELQIRTFGHPI